MLQKNICDIKLQQLVYEHVWKKKKNHTLSQEDVVITIELDAATESLAFTAVERDIES
jgi:hypothetical protein